MIDIRKYLNKFNSKLIAEGVLRSVLVAGTAAFTAMIITAIALLIASVNMIWISPIVGVVVWVLCTIVAYFATYKPTMTSMAERIDLLGLEERVITMLELENNDSYIAKRQREDAIREIEKVNSSKIKIVLSKGIVICTSVLLLISVCLITVSGLYLNGTIKVPPPIIENEKNLYMDISYNASKGGVVIGKVNQSITRGGETEQVEAIAAEGFIFIKWTDDNLSNKRSESNVIVAMDIVALFMNLEDGSISIDKDNIEDEKPENPPPAIGGQPGSGGQYENFDQVIDGTIDYKDVLEEFYQKYKKDIEEGRYVSEEARRIIELYFGAIE